MALAESRRHFRCGHCGSYGFPEPADADGVRPLTGSAAASPPCPACAEPLRSALLDDAHPVHVCSTCRGVLIPRATFAGIIMVRRAWASNPPAAAEPLDRQALDRERKCPTCRERLATHPYYGPGNVVIDTCAVCEVVWLDFGELRQIVDAPGRDRGSRNLEPLIDDVDTSREGAGDRAGDRDESDALDLLLKLFS